MKIYFMPKTAAGKWSAWLIVAFIILFASFLLLVASGQRGGEGFFDNLLLTVPVLLAGIAGVASLLTGVISAIRFKERSILVYLATLIGLLVLLFILGEIVFPH